MTTALIGISIVIVIVIVIDEDVVEGSNPRSRGRNLLELYGVVKG